MDNYDAKVAKNTKRNEKFINEFNKWLKKKNLSAKTIRKHLNNIDLYLNYYLNYYEIIKMEDGIRLSYDYFDDWFIRKCAFASVTSLKENVASVKKFYECMCEKKYVTENDYKNLCKMIKENMDNFLTSLIEILDYEDEEWEEFI